MYQLLIIRNSRLYIFPVSLGDNDSCQVKISMSWLDEWNSCLFLESPSDPGIANTI